AGDLASFNNANPTDVLQALKSGLVGETEPLRRFGVNLNDARIKAEALRIGLVDSTVDQAKFSTAQETAQKAARKVGEVLKKNGEGSVQYADAVRDAEQANAALEDVLGGKMPATLDAATKAQAAYSLIMQDTTLAQGDFQRTSGGLANQSRILGAQFTDLKAKVGTALLPAVTSVVVAMNRNLIPAFSKISAVAGPIIKEITFGFRGMVAVFRGQESADAFGGFAAIFAKVGEVARVAFDFIRASIPRVVAAFRQLAGFVTGTAVPALVQFAKAIGPSIGAALVAYGRFLFQFWSGVLRAAINFIQSTAIPALIRLGEWLGPKLAAAGQFVNASVIPALQRFGAFVRGTVIPALVEFAQWLGPKLGAAAKIYGQIFVTFWGTVFEVIKTGVVFVATKVIPALIEFAQWLGPKLVAVARGFAGFVTGTLVPAFQSIARFVTDTIIPAFTKLVDYFKVKILPVLVNVAGLVGDVLVVAFRIYSTYITDVLIPVLGLVWSYFTNIVLPAISAVAGFFIDTFLPVLTVLWQAFRDDILPVLVTVGSYIADELLTSFDRMVTVTRTQIIPALSEFWQFLKLNVLPIFADVVGAVTTFVTTSYDKISGFVRDAKASLDGFISFFVGLKDRISGVFDGAFDGLKEAFRSAINFIIDGWNGIKISLPGFDPPGPGSFDGFDVPWPHIPRLAGGAAINSPTLAWIGEKASANPEIVAPQQILRDTFREELRRFTPGNRTTVEIGQLISNQPPRAWLEEQQWRIATGVL
ncbi:MAG: hypothetical protein ABL908_09825, partial [Hyphomicrobium sp.]